MSSYRTKVYLVQRANGVVVGVKLTFAAAHALSRRPGVAPARVIYVEADKDEHPNVSAQPAAHAACK